MNGSDFNLLMAIIAIIAALIGAFGVGLAMGVLL